MNVTPETVKALEQTHLERLEADVVKELASRLALVPEEALERYYGSRLSRWVAQGKNGVQFLSPACLVDWLLDEQDMGGDPAGLGECDPHVSERSTSLC